jgi:hypothetical protein
MKKYFLKYLPVDGEIKNGELVYDTVNPDFRIELFECRIDGDILYDDRGFVRNKEHCKPVRLFVCSYDLKIGDKVWNPADLYSDDGELRSLEELKELRVFKVIGEVSDDALWARERDEFDEDEIRIVYGSPVKKVWSAGESKHVLEFFGHWPEEWEIEDSAKNWAEHEDFGGHSRGYTLYWNEEPTFVKRIQLFGHCKHFH